METPPCGATKAPRVRTQTEHLSSTARPECFSLQAKLSSAARCRRHCHSLAGRAPPPLARWGCDNSTCSSTFRYVCYDMLWYVMICYALHIIKVFNKSGNFHWANGCLSLFDLLCQDSMSWAWDFNLSVCRFVKLLQVVRRMTPCGRLTTRFRKCLVQLTSFSSYPLVNCPITIENHHF